MKLGCEIDCLFWTKQRPSGCENLVSDTIFKSLYPFSNTLPFGGLSEVPQLITYITLKGIQNIYLNI